MTVTVTHSTPADGTFSGTGTTAWNADHTVTGLPTLTGTPADGDISYWTGSATQALLEVSGAVTGGFIRFDGTSPDWSTLILPDAATSGGVLYASASNTIASSGALTANAFLTGGGAGTAPNAVALTGIILGNGASAPTALTNPLPVANGGTAGTTVQAATQTLTTPRVVYKQGLPMVYAATGTMTGSPNGDGNFTLGTALTGVQPGRCLIYLPANAVVAAGSAAGWYFATMSSTTAGIVVDTTPYTPSSTPPAWPSSPTAPTTAQNWTSDTGEITAVSFSVPANSLGANGILDFGWFQLHQTNNANAKSIKVSFGALASAAQSAASLATTNYHARVANAGTANNMLISGIGTNIGTGTVVNGTVDTTSAVTTTLNLSKGTATDNIGIMPFYVRIISDGT